MKRVTIAALCLTLAGCGVPTAATITAGGNGSPPASAPAPASTSAAIAGHCVMGYEDQTFRADGSGYQPTGYSNFTPGAPQGVTENGNYFPPALAYQVTLTNSGQATAEVTGFTVVFTTDNIEQGSGSVNATPAFITPGQSLAWTEVSDIATDGTTYTEVVNPVSIPGSPATCALLQWDSPP